MTIERIKLDVELNDGSEHHISVGNPSLVNWDRARVSYGWPSIAEAPFLWMTYIAWHHMKSVGIIPRDTKYEVFENELCVAIADPDEQARAEAKQAGGEFEGDAVDPTVPTPAPESALP